MGLNVVMLGAPGAGKGTQAERFASRRGLLKISTGDILRQGIKDQIPVALVAKAKMDRGELVDDATMVAIVRERLSRPDTEAGFILDGFPRTVEQARALDGIIADQGKTPLVIVDIVVQDVELVRRIAARRICAACGQNATAADGAVCGRCGGALVQRPDDNEAVVLERLRVYARSTKPLVDFYRTRSTFRTVNGAQAPDLVARELETRVDEVASRSGTSTQELAGR